MLPAGSLIVLVVPSARSDPDIASHARRQLAGHHVDFLVQLPEEGQRVACDHVVGIEREHRLIVFLCIAERAEVVSKPPQIVDCSIPRRLDR